MFRKCVTCTFVPAQSRSERQQCGKYGSSNEIIFIRNVTLDIGTYCCYGNSKLNTGNDGFITMYNIPERFHISCARLILFGNT